MKRTDREQYAERQSFDVFRSFDLTRLSVKNKTHYLGALTRLVEVGRGLGLEVLPRLPDQLKIVLLGRETVKRALLVAEDPPTGAQLQDVALRASPRARSWQGASIMSLHITPRTGPDGEVLSSFRIRFEGRRLEWESRKVRSSIGEACGTNLGNSPTLMMKIATSIGPMPQSSHVQLIEAIQPLQDLTNLTFNPIKVTPIGQNNNGV